MTNKNLLKILFVEDLPSDADLAVMELRKEGLKFEHKRVDTRDEFVKTLNEFRPDIVISDYKMPSYDGMRALLDSREFDPFIPFILCTGSMNEETAVECLKAGADDYIIKEHLTRLPFAVKEALEQYRIKKEKRAAELLLIESEEKLESIFSAAPVGIGLVVDRVFMEVNDTFCKMTGYTRKALIGKSSELIYATKEEYERDGTEKYRQISEKGIGTVETRFKCKNGDTLNILLSSAPLDKDDLTKGVTFTAMDITEKKRIEEALRESEERFRNLYNDAVVGLYRTNSQGKILLANKVLVKMLGFQSQKELATINLNESSIGTNYNRKTFIDQIEKEGEVKDLEAIWICRDGKEIFVRENAKAIYDSEGKILYYNGTVEDISEWKKTEKELLESEEKYRRIFSNIQDMYYETTMEGTILEISPSVSTLSSGQYHREDLIGKSMFEFYSHPGERYLLMEALKATGIVSDFEISLKNRDGSLIPCSISSKICFDDNGKPEKIVGSTHDITDRKKAEESVIRSKKEFQNYFESGSVGMSVTLPDNKWIEVNQRLCKMFGYSKNELIGLNWEDLTLPDDLAHDFELVQQALDGEIDNYELDKRFIRKDGRIVYVTLSVVCDRNPDGSVHHFLSSYLDITARKELEETLRQERNLLRTLVDNIPDPVSIKDSEHRYLLNNKAHLDLIGAEKQEDAIGKTAFDFFNHDDAALFNKDEEDVIQLGKESLYKDEKIFNLEANEVKSFMTSKIPLKDSLGNLIGIITVSHDITERVKAEERILRERIMLRTLIDNLPDMIYVKDFDCRKVLANIEDVKNIGYEKEEEVLGKTDLELFPGDIGQRGFEDDKKVIDSGKAIIDREEDFFNSNGVQRWLLTSKIPLHDNDGKITGLVGIGHDITTIKKATSDLQQSFAFNESLLKTIPFGMDIVDETGTILFQSEYFKRLFSEEATGKKCWEMYRDDKKQCCDCPLTHGITVGETEAFESYGVLGNRIFEINHTGMMYQGKKAMLEIFQDITDRKTSEIELRIAKEKAEEGDRLKTSFLHNISHEIRTPMNAIVGFSALLGEPNLDSQTQQFYIETILQSSNHLLAIITDIIDISNIEANIVKVVRNNLNINFTLKSICNQFSIKAREKKIELICESRLSDSEALIITDNTKFTQILTNLVGNAIKFTDEGSVKVVCRKVDNSLEISVSDTGIGILTEYQTKIFDRFYQVQNAVSRLYEGTGLGLAISKAYVGLMGGKISLSSVPGKGTTFFFTVPYEKQTIAILPVVEKPLYEGFVFPEMKTILVAEDIDSNYKLISYFLSRANTKLLRAENGKEAVDIALAEKGIDLILMDIKMPEMDGFTATKLIREADIKIPIVAQTAYADDEESAIKSGCNGFISKPFDKKHLIKVLSEFI